MGFLHLQPEQYMPSIGTGDYLMPKASHAQSSAEDFTTSIQQIHHDTAKPHFSSSSFNFFASFARSSHSAILSSLPLDLC